VRGPKPKPTKLKELEGNPGKRALNKQEPKAESAIPPCPNHLTGAAKTEWNRLTVELHALGLISKIDRAALAICCTAWADYVKAENKLKKQGEVIISDKGGMYQNPWVAIKKRSMDQIVKFYAEFGMTPSSRSFSSSNVSVRLSWPQRLARTRTPDCGVLQRRKTCEASETSRLSIDPAADSFEPLAQVRNDWASAPIANRRGSSPCSSKTPPPSPSQVLRHILLS
jgi:P27 family predicted phage terminase small subunit